MNSEVEVLLIVSNIFLFLHSFDYDDKMTSKDFTNSIFC